jgi:hypothetical protein
MDAGNNSHCFIYDYPNLPHIILNIKKEGGEKGDLG